MSKHIQKAERRKPLRDLYTSSEVLFFGGVLMNEKEVKRKLAAILSDDVLGYSRLMEEDEVTTVRTVEEYRGVISEFIEKHRGRVVNSPGDNLLAEFGSVVDAVECAAYAGTISSRSKDPNKAMEQCNKALKINPNDIIAHMILTQIYSYQNRMEEARFHASEMLRINPNYSIKLSYLNIRICLKMKRPTRPRWNCFARLGYQKDDNQSVNFYLKAKQILGFGEILEKLNVTFSKHMVFHNHRTFAFSRLTELCL